MKLYLDNIIFNLQKFGGISVYWNELIKFMIESESLDKLVYLEIQNGEVKFNERALIPKENIISDRNIPLSILRYLPIRNSIIEKDAILHSSYFRYSSNKNIRNIITVYDFTYELYIKGLSEKIHHYQKYLALKNASGIICISENTKKDLMHFFPKIKEENIMVTHLATNDEFYKIDNFDILNSPYKNLAHKKVITFVGKRVDYKNFKIALELIKRLSDNYHLLVIGGGDFSPGEFDQMKNDKDKITHLPSISNKELNVIYNISFCFLYPSEYEGFGIPVLESMQAGCPVLCQNISSIPEVYGKVDNLVMNINSIDEFEANLLRLDNSEYRIKLINQGFENVKRFNWNNTFTKTMSFYKQLSK